jgi:hypothetical protein
MSQQDINQELDKLKQGGGYIDPDSALGRARLTVWTPREMLAIWDWLVEFMKANPNAKVLETFCGRGDLSHELSKLFPSATFIAMDMQEPAITDAITYHKGTRVEFRIGNVLKDLPEGTFDLMFSALGDLHLPDPDKSDPSVVSPLETYWKTTWDKLNPGGRMVKFEPHWLMNEGAPILPFYALMKLGVRAMAKFSAGPKNTLKIQPFFTALGAKVTTKNLPFTMGGPSQAGFEFWGAAIAAVRSVAMKLLLPLVAGEPIFNEGEGAAEKCAQAIEALLQTRGKKGEGDLTVVSESSLNQLIEACDIQYGTVPLPGGVHEYVAFCIDKPLSA